MSYQDSTTTVEQRSSRRRLAGGAERGAPMSQSAYSRLRGAATPKPPVAIERVTPHGRPDAAQGVQPGLRGLDGETPSCAGLCGGRTRVSELSSLAQPYLLGLGVVAHGELAFQHLQQVLAGQLPPPALQDRQLLRGTTPAFQREQLQV